MSLDVYLTTPGETRARGSGIFVRENGETRELTREEWGERFPDAEPVVAVRDDETETVYSANITHNLGQMAGAAGIYTHLWRPEEVGVSKAAQLIEPLRAGLALLKSDRPRFEQYNATNGWGLYEHFVPFVEAYLRACEENPEAIVSVWR